MGTLILVANPGSASRKYALYRDSDLQASLHFEFIDDQIVCTFASPDQHETVVTDLHELTHAADRIVPILRDQGSLQPDEQIAKIGLRVVAPSAYFLQDRQLHEATIAKLEELKARAPLHIEATLHEFHALRRHFKTTSIIGISDSAFHVTKPNYAWNYGLPLHDADRFDIKRFGYHGLSVSAAVRTVKAADKLTPKLIVCHLGSGNSINAVHSGKSFDTTMGYSPLEGPIMATRTGSIDPTALQALQTALNIPAKELDTYVNQQSGLLGLSGRSSDIRQLLQYEGEGDHRAELALQTYVYSVQKAIGQMSAALGGIDMLIFTGTVGERSNVIRQRVVDRLHYLDLFIDNNANNNCLAPDILTCISRLAQSKPIYVVPTDEASEIARRILRFQL